ncbi:MAG: copper homeostasis protein CutC [Nocardioides sp.]|nr:copper homeostasis protein CutC [Nocardioides sp.]
MSLPSGAAPGPALLEVAVVGPRDVPGAQEGGADRLRLSAGGPDDLSPEPALVSAVCRESAVPVRVVLRLDDSLTTTGGGFQRLAGLGESYVSAGAEGVAFGFLDRDLEVDVETCAALAERLHGVPWTFSRAVDSVLEPHRAWRRLPALPGLTAVHSAGSPQGLGVGYDDLLALAGEPGVAALLMPGGGLAAEQVPWFVRAGVRQFHLDVQARPGGSEKAYVDVALVRSWRLLLDDAVAAAEARPGGTSGTGRTTA